MNSAKKLQYVIYKFFGIEEFEVVNLFADARKDYGYLQLGAKRNDKAALCRAVELGKDYPVELYRAVEHLRKIQEHKSQ